MNQVGWSAPAERGRVSPTVFRAGSLRFYFFSLEEPRIHVHVRSPHGRAKFWVAPEIELVWNRGLTRQELTRARRLIGQHENAIREAWKRHHNA